MINVPCFEMSKLRNSQNLQIARQHGDMAGWSLETFGEKDAIISVTHRVSEFEPLTTLKTSVDLHFQGLSQVLLPTAVCCPAAALGKPIPPRY